MFVIMLIAITALVVLIGWIFYRAHDWSATSLSLAPYKKILVLFPHPDDEVLTCGGVVATANSQGITTCLAVTTQGERGTPDAHLDGNLKALRLQELTASAAALGYTSLRQWHIPDGEVTAYRSVVELLVTKTLAWYQPDLVITYDLSGLYGHPDHITLAEIVTKHVKKTNTKLWYYSLPAQQLALLDLPEHMAQDPEFKNRRMLPTHKVWVGPRGVLAKLSALNQYVSQYQSFGIHTLTGRVRMTLMILLSTFEYFYEVKK